MNAADLIVGSLVLLIAALIIARMVSNRRRGRRGCSGCAGCSAQNSCPASTTRQQG